MTSPTQNAVLSSTFATRPESPPASTTRCTPFWIASTVSSGTGPRRRRWLTTTCTGRPYRHAVLA